MSDHLAPAAAPDRVWLSHHAPEHSERCLHVRGVAICRRCAVLYPVALCAAVLFVALDAATGWLVAAMWVLPAPMAAEWIGEHLGRLRYDPRRQIAVTALGAPALGAALAITWERPFSPAAVLPIAVWTLCCAGVALWTQWRALPELDAGWEARHEADEVERRERLRSLLDGVESDGDDSGGTQEQRTRT